MTAPTNLLWARLFSEIKSNIPAAIDTVIYQELWRTIEDFLSETNIWTEEIPFMLQPNVFTYEVTPVGNGMIERLLMVYDPENAGPDKRWIQQGIQFAPPNKVVLAYSPSTSKEVVAVVAKNITDLDVLPPDHPEHLPVLGTSIEWVINKYRDAFRFGTLGLLMLQTAKPYSNPKLAGYNWQNYVSMRGRARADVLHSNVYGGQRWMYPQGYATTARKGWT